MNSSFLWRVVFLLLGSLSVFFVWGVLHLLENARAVVS